MRSGLLTEKAIFSSPYTESLGHVTSYKEEFARWCDIREVKYSEQEIDSLNVAQDISQFCVRYDPKTLKVTHAWRIEHESLTYSILRIYKADRKKQWIKFDAVAIDE